MLERGNGNIRDIFNGFLRKALFKQAISEITGFPYIKKISKKNFSV